MIWGETPIFGNIQMARVCISSPLQPQHYPPPPPLKESAGYTAMPSWRLGVDRKTHVGPRLRGKQRYFFLGNGQPPWNPDWFLKFWGNFHPWTKQVFFFVNFFKQPSPKAVFSSYLGTLKNFEPNPCCLISIEAPWFFDPVRQLKKYMLIITKLWQARRKAVSFHNTLAVHPPLKQCSRVAFQKTRE